MGTPTLDGAAVFGVAVRSVMDPEKSEFQFNTFFGLNGVMSLFGGTRGRSFRVAGLLLAPELEGLAAPRNALLAFDDGMEHTYVDTIGSTWDHVVFDSFRQTGPPAVVAGGGWSLPYAVTLAGRM